jgi:O-antigen ligase
MNFLTEIEISRLRDFFLAERRRGLNWPLVVLLVGVAVLSGALLAYLTPVGGIVVLVAGVGALLMLRDLRWALLALLGVICLLPFASLPFKIGFTPTFLDLVFAALYVVWAARLVTRRQEDFVLTPVGWPVLIFVALTLFSFVLGLSHSRPTSNDLRTFAEVLMGIGMFMLIVNNVRDESWLRFLTAALILGGAGQAVIGVFLYFIPKTWAVRLLNPLARLSYPVGPGALRYINDDPNRPMRAIGTSVDPNILGALLVIVMAVAGVQLVARRPVLRRGWLALCLALMGGCLFLTYSRSSMVGAVAALGILAVLRYRRLLVVLLIAGLLLLLLPQTQAYLSHMIEGFRIEDRATQMRVGEYRDALKLIQRYPWVGVGFVGTPDIDLYLAVAMIYLTILGQMGIVGLVVFCLVMAVFLLYVYRAWRALPSDAPLEPFLLGYGAAIFGSLVAGFFDHTLLPYPHAVALLWFVLGMGAAAARLAVRPDRRRALLAQDGLGHPSALPVGRDLGVVASLQGRPPVVEDRDGRAVF